MSRITQSGFWIALVEQESESAKTIGRLLQPAGYPEPRYFADPARALADIETSPPSLIIVSVDMPDMAGLLFIQELRHTLPSEVFLPVLATGEGWQAKIKRQAVSAGANDFLAKPVCPHSVLLYVGSLLSTSCRVRRMGHLLNEALACGEEEGGQSLLETLARLGQVAELRDDETRQHAARVGQLSGLLARELRRAPEEVQLLALAAPLHDLGKAFVADRILFKKGDFEDFERQLMQRHALAGAELLKGASSDVLRTGEVIASSHHERWDGHGYPTGLTGISIPLAGRIVAVAEAFDALTHARPHRSAASVADALAEIRWERGRQFDPDVVDALLRVKEPSLCVSAMGSTNLCGLPTD
ncbi:MAG: HD domain-containing phosphohydrolase [Pseudomonadota bacterium]